ncbi:ABC transporter ATP-binding protein [Siminovitchia sp. FSL H7-0308]|uniref:Sn-glycerol 3-phosphate transport system ATP-binding protein n=1 Tax=Siminovitchia thermophila TaxID=1245522 RepID=A0ABS2R6W6_9BACI|nr:ABC transporter ATP-binding protein [Siminovitchia thermophila]MBM7715405.1 sn-glycerol 3-phosphate transport system ATP-binding protein [Siminovitchia thermophila]ONK22579.1 ABC transporter ATP-binding protein [Bacillus sp. VT-16-64]
MASIEFKQVTKTFQQNVVIEDLNLKIKDGSFTVLVGPSGCGKTTLLRMIAGIGPQTSGQVMIGEKDVTNIPPGKRGVSMVFQNYALYPTMTVRGNIEFGLVNHKVKKHERKQLVGSISKSVGLFEYLDRMPSTLSGGQRQRVALARAMVKNPSVFLMDEPLSNLDAKLRAQMRIDLIELHRKLGTTFVYVTHDQVEAMSMADTIVLMNKGVIQQEAPPEEMYRDPNNLFVAQFIGVPPMNISNLGVDHVKFGFRPEKLILSTSPIKSYFSIKGRIVTREMLGSETIYQIRYNDISFMAKSTEDKYQVDQDINVGVQAEDIFFFGENEERIRPDHPNFQSYLEKLREY